MGKASFRLLLLLFTVSLSALALGQDADRMGELSANLMELQKKLQACGSNTQCQQKVAQEMSALMQQYQGLAKSGGQTAQLNFPTCANFFRPGWSCLPVKMQVADQVEVKGYGSYPVAAGEWKWYVANDASLAYNAVGSGILIYTKGYGQFEIWIRCLPADCHVTQFRWAKKNASYSGYSSQNWTSSSGPQGPVRVTNPCGFSVHYPPAKATPPLPDIHCKFSPVIVACDDEWGGQNGTRVPYEGSPPFQMTPAMAKSMVDSGQFTKTFAWQVRTAASKDDPSYESHNLSIRLEVGEPPPPAKPGVLAVTPGDGFSSNRPDPKKPFAPLSKTYTLKNTSEQAINYSVDKKANWLNLDATTGSLPPGGSATVTVAVNVPVAGKLIEDTYKDTINFTNTTNGKGNTTRPADVTLGEEQAWRATVKGWYKDVIKWDGLVYTDEKGKKTKVIQAVRFNWNLTGEFIIKKDRGKWVYKDGKITAAKLIPATDFQPKHIYDCSIFDCQGKKKIAAYVGDYLAGTIMPDNRVILRWWPFNPAACVSCKPKHPDLPKNLYEAQFESGEFITQISLESYPLANKTSKPVQKQDVLYYTVTLERLK